MVKCSEILSSEFLSFGDFSSCKTGGVMENVRESSDPGTTLVESYGKGY